MLQMAISTHWQGEYHQTTTNTTHTADMDWHSTINTNMPSTTTQSLPLPWYLPDNHLQLQAGTHHILTLTKKVHPPPPDLSLLLIYKQCYLPTLGYPLLATVIPPTKVNKHQGLTTTTFLTKMDTLAHFPLLMPQRIKEVWDWDYLEPNKASIQFSNSSNTSIPRQPLYRSMELYFNTTKLCPASPN